MRETDPRDDADALGLQEARDGSDPGPSIGHQRYEPAEDVDDTFDLTCKCGPGHDECGIDCQCECHDPITGEPPSWRDRYDTREEWEGSR